MSAVGTQLNRGQQMAGKKRAKRTPVEIAAPVVVLRAGPGWPSTRGRPGAARNVERRGRDSNSRWASDP